VLVWTNEAYLRRRLEGLCYHYFGIYGYDRFIQCENVQRFLHATMFPYPIPEGVFVGNEWDYGVTWVNRTEGVMMLPLQNRILEKKRARNGEMWLLGEPIPLPG